MQVLISYVTVVGSKQEAELIGVTYKAKLNWLFPTVVVVTNNRIASKI